MYHKAKQLRPRKLRSEEGVKNKDRKVLFEERDILERWGEYIGYSKMIDLIYVQIQIAYIILQTSQKRK